MDWKVAGTPAIVFTITFPLTVPVGMLVPVTDVLMVPASTAALPTVVIVACPFDCACTGGGCGWAWT